LAGKKIEIEMDWTTGMECPPTHCSQFILYAECQNTASFAISVVDSIDERMLFWQPTFEFFCLLFSPMHKFVFARAK